MDRAEREALLARLRADAARVADHFGLTYSAIDAEHPRVKSRYGVCFDTGLIRIRLNHAKTGRPLKYSSLIDTLCHELAHLRHFNHGPQFKAFFLELLAWARREGIYRPAPRPHRGGHFAPAAIARPDRAKPERRNGVAVFGAPAREHQPDRLPWERREVKPAAERRPPAPPKLRAPRPTKQPAPPAKTPDNDLPLFAGTSGAPAPIKRRPPRAKGDKPAVVKKGQLSLFD